MGTTRLRFERRGRSWMTKQFDSVQMMREIRDRMSERYSDPEIEERELEQIRTKYGIK